jgi:hypothetical protein
MKIEDVATRLNESVEIVNGVTVVRNGTINQVLSMWRRSAHRELRGLRSDDDIFWWDASLMTHGDAARELGISDYVGRRLQMLDHSGTPQLDDSDWTAVLDGSPKWDQYLKHYELLFWTPMLGFSSGRDAIEAYSKDPR